MTPECIRNQLVPKTDANQLAPGLVSAHNPQFQTFDPGLLVVGAESTACDQISITLLHRTR